MKRYLVFGINQYYPAGGLDDVEESFDTVEEAVPELGENGMPWSDWVFLWDRIDDVEYLWHRDAGWIEDKK